MNSYLYLEKSSGSTGKHFRALIRFFYYLLWVSKFLTTLIFSKNQRQCASFFNKRFVRAGHHRVQKIDRQSALHKAEKHNID